MIMAVLGGTVFTHEQVFNQLMKQPKSISVRIANIPQGANRTKLIQTLLGEKENSSDTFVISGLINNDEVKMIRSLGGAVCHVRGLLGKIYNEVVMHPSDKHIYHRKHKNCPDHVISAGEAWSECVTKQNNHLRQTAND